ncbi:hypothetical protein Dda_3404 [Drechslerella dactyloides]|uniref:DNL-type domain-containing protein n=1 Tax=Drechslerella dactyloides TaxID=74499 RepID=A0AAD6J1B2_DREDA|nr:hypothetical protein Dda_3404 [Drechslerella dactyloides]
MRTSASRIARPLARISHPLRLSAIRPFPRPILPPRALPPTLSSTCRKYSSADSPSILSPPSQNTSSTSPSSTSSDDAASSPASTTASFQLPEKPAYEMTFTCKKCNTRSTHRVSKQAYRHGTVLIQCPGCTVRHLIADHMKIFRDKPTTIEDILREKGESVLKGIKYHDGDIEFLPPEAVEEGEKNAESPAAAEVKTDGQSK